MCSCLYILFEQQRERYSWTAEELAEVLAKLIKTEEETVFGARLLLQKVTQQTFSSLAHLLFFSIILFSVE